MTIMTMIITIIIIIIINDAMRMKVSRLSLRLQIAATTYLSLMVWNWHKLDVIASFCRAKQVVLMWVQELQNEWTVSTV